MNCQSILVVTYGRTGSTLLMGLLNTSPKMRIAGENFNFCGGLYQAYTSLVRAKEEHGKNPTESTDPFFGVDQFDEAQFFADARRLLENQIVPAQRRGVEVWGFKEIRYLSSNLAESRARGLGDYLSFLERLAPTPAFVFLTRRHADVAQSAFWKDEDPAQVIALLEEFERHGREWSAARSNCFWIDYSEFAAEGRREGIQNLFSFLGAEYDEAAVAVALKTEHSYGGNPRNLVHVQVRTRKIRVAAVTSPGLVTGVVDQFPHEIDAAEPFSVSGVVVPEAADVSSITVEPPAPKDLAISLNRSSPWYAERYPGNPRAAHARFEISGLQFGPDGILELVAVLSDGTKGVFARLELVPPI